MLLPSDALLRFAPARNFHGTPGALNLRPLTTANLPWAKGGVPYGNKHATLISWHSYNQDGGGNGIYAQRFNADGSKNGAEFLVNTHTSSDKYNASVTSLTGGGFLISWQSTDQDGWNEGIYAQRYNADGSKNGAEFLVNTHTTGGQHQPSATSLTGGGFLISWTSNGQDDSGSGIYAQRFNADGSKNGAEFLVNTHTSNSQYQPSVTSFTHGGFLISWSSSNQDGSSWGIYAQRYNADGSKNGNEFQVNTYTSSEQNNPSVTSFTGGGFLISWQSYNQDGSSNGIYAQRFNADGSKNSNEFQVNTYTSSEQNKPSVTSLTGGGFLISWTSNGQDDSGSGIYAQRFNADGSKNGAEFLVNTHTASHQDQPSVTSLTGGGFLISWSSLYQDGSGWGIYAQRFNADGSKNGAEFLVNTHTSSDQNNPSVGSFSSPLQDLAALGLSNLADPVAVSINITPLNDPPSLTSSSTPLAGAAAGQSVSFSAADLLSGYSDIDGDSLSITAVSLVNTDTGSLTGDATNDWTFSPATDFIGTVELAFSVSDGTVTVNDHTSFSIGSGSGGAGTENNDSLIGTTEPDNLSGLSGDDLIDGMDGNDVIDGAAGSDQLRGGSGDDTLTGGDHDDILQGGSGDDHLAGDAGSDQLYGARGNDLLQGGSGDDIATGDSGRDALQGGSGSDQLIGGEGDDLLDGAEGDDILQGGNGDDWLIGGPGSDDQRGGVGNDTFLAIGVTVSDDIFDGGDGTDTLITGAQSERGANYVDASLRSIERLELLPTHYADRFNYWEWDLTNYANRGSRFSLDQLGSFNWIGSTSEASWSNELHAFSVRDFTDIGSSKSWRWLRVAGEGSLDLSAANWDIDTLYRISSEAGPQTLLGTTNSDWFASGDGQDSLHGRSGDDSLLGELGNDLLVGGSGDDHLEGNAGTDTLYGGDGNDILIGGGSHDLVYGEAGNDTVELNWGQIELTGGGGAGYWYDNSTSISGTYDGGDGSDTLRIQAMQWSGSDQRGAGQTIDLRNASLANFERLEIGTSAILRLTGSQYSQFSSGVSKIAGYEGATNLAIDLSPGEELRFSRTAGINSASGALNISGADSAFSDTLAINSDGTVDLSDPNTLISGVETLEIQRGTVILTAEQWNSFDNIKAKGSGPKTISLTGTENIDLSKLSRSSDSNTTIDINLTADQFNTSDFEDFSDLFRKGTGSAELMIRITGGGQLELFRNKSQFDLILDSSSTYKLIGTDTANHIKGTPQEDTIDAGGGDDNIETSDGNDFIDGGNGDDTLIASAEVVNLTQKTLKNLEILDINGASVHLSAEQFNSFSSITGSGSVQLSTGGNVYSDRNQGSFDLHLAQEPTTLIGTSGDDTIRLDISRTATIRIDGADGHDTLELTGSGIANFDELDLQSIEAINLDGASLRLTAAQLADATINGHGALHLSDGLTAKLPIQPEGANSQGPTGTRSIADILASTPTLTGAALTGNAATAEQGEWQFSRNAGKRWTSIPTTLEADGSAALLLPSDALLRFAPARNFHGTPGALNLRPLTTANLPWAEGGVPYGNKQATLISWHSYHQDGGGWGIYAQRFNADGSKHGAEVLVNTHTSSDQYQPSVASLTDGGFLISWQSYNQDGSNWGIYAQRYNADGSKNGSEFLVNTAHLI
ncbi:cadherin-like domain-containing protein [Synechococcus sp. KORDI-49]|uniref:cadherin-like domain-containing protein n=1 Tax=Synechococcus sp. KORDI-49 TaxID=585423 RepID=UPI00138DE92A|nr:cadherin-like domain-containing protein [Synechococcus sp. KORDI-49]